METKGKFNIKIAPKERTEDEIADVCNKWIKYDEVVIDFSKTGEACKHPPTRLFSWIALDETGEILCVGCCDCGKTWTKPLKGRNKNENLQSKSMGKSKEK